MISLSGSSSLWALCAWLVLLAGVPGSWSQGGGPPEDGGPGPGQSQSSTESLGVECDRSGSSADYLETLRGDGSVMERVVGSSTNCPNHINWPINPNAARVIGWNETIPAYPMMFASGGTTDLSSAALYTGIMLNGVSLFSSWARDEVVSYEDTAFAIESDTFDPCGGHATEDGYYHYHSTPGCLQEQAMEEAGTTSAEHSPQLGWALDGFPVYGQLGPGGVEMLMCGVTGAHDTYCLDVCSGYEGELAEVDDFLYRYYLSCGADEVYFPFTTNCYRGCCPEGLTCGAHVEDCGTSPDEGYTSTYVPETASDLSGVYDSTLLAGNDSEYIGSMTTLDCSLYLGSSGSSDNSTETIAPATTMPSMMTTAPTVTKAPSSTISPMATISPTMTMAPVPTMLPTSTMSPMTIMPIPGPTDGSTGAPSPSTVARSIAPSSASTDEPGGGTETDDNTSGAMSTVSSGLLLMVVTTVASASVISRAM